MTEENKTIQTENKPSADEAILNADQAEQAQHPAVNPPAPPAPAQNENNEAELFMTKFYNGTVAN
ncbi:hypothetical protein KJ586_04350 [Patescibacteria group bacterium]|nr:hypothetical protein [Patescibacteria group bacterium]